MIRLSIWALALATAMCSAQAATFRVTFKVYQRGGPDVLAEHWILFDNGLIYDVPQKLESRFVTVFDPAQQRVTLLDRQDQVQTTLHTNDLLDVTARARASAKTPQQQQRIGLTATVQPSKQVNGHTIRFGDFEYHTTTQTPSQREIATDYGRFALLTSQLSIVRRVGPPPFGRMTLNQYLAERGQLPLETTLTVGHGDQAQELRSTHSVTDLSDADREQINQVRGMMSLYREVKLTEFP